MTLYVFTSYHSCVLLPDVCLVTQQWGSQGRDDSQTVQLSL